MKISIHECFQSSHCISYFSLNRGELLVYIIRTIMSQSMLSPKWEKGRKSGLTILPLYCFSFIFTTGKYICTRQIHCKFESQIPASIKMELLWIHISMTKNPLAHQWKYILYSQAIPILLQWEKQNSDLPNIRCWGNCREEEKRQAVTFTTHWRTHTNVPLWQVRCGYIWIYGKQQQLLLSVLYKSTAQSHLEQHVLESAEIKSVWKTAVREHRLTNTSLEERLQKQPQRRKQRWHTIQGYKTASAT